MPAGVPADRFPPPWTVIPRDESFEVVAANGAHVAYVYVCARPIVGTGAAYPTHDAARRIALNIAKLPALLGRTPRAGQPR